MDRKLARKNIRSGLIAGAICVFMFGDRHRGRKTMRTRSEPAVSDTPQDAPPAGEEIHLPGSSMIPFTTAIGITLAVIGTTISWLVSIVGVIIFVICLYRWIKDTWPRRRGTP